jgi:tetratricopeptide (TPR) repeat protein
VLATVAFAGGRVLPRGRAPRLALILLAAFVAWAYLGLLWSDSPGDGLAAANKLLLALLVAWLLALLPWTPRSAMVFMAAWVVGITAVCAVSLVGARGGPIADYFVKDRYADPTGYSNATSALAVMAFWPALVLAYRRTTPIILRPAFLAAATFLLLFSLIPQSRGSIIGLALTLPLFVLLAPERLRLIPVGLVLAGAIAISLGPVYHLYDVSVEVIFHGSKQPVGPVLDDAVDRIGVAVLLAALAGVVLAVLDRVVRPSERVARQTGRIVAVVLIAAAVVGVGVAAVNASSISDGVSERYDTFKNGEDIPPDPGARLGRISVDQRYDYWRVGLNGFRERPLAGIGTGAYERYYTKERRAEKPSRYAHDLWLRVLSELGLVGFALLVGFLAVVLGRPVLQFRRADAAAAAVAAGAVAASFGFFVHASFDWIEEFPALLSPALALPLVALVATSPARPARRGRVPGLAVALVGIVALAAAGLALVPAYLSSRYDDRGARIWTAVPSAAFRDLERAANLAPLSARPQLRAGSLALELHRYRHARQLFTRSLEREDTWYAHFELALIASRAGELRQARRQIRIARSLNREDRFVSEAVHKIGKGDRLDPGKLNQGIRDLNRARFTAPRN